MLIGKKNVLSYLNSLELIRKLLINFSIILCAIQVFIDFSWSNIICNLLVLVTFIPTCFVVFNKNNKNMGRALVVTAIFLNVAANTLAPVLGTILEGHSLTYSLIVPQVTFFHRMIFAYTLLASFYIARSLFFAPLEGMMLALGKRTNVGMLVSKKVLWVFGFVGLSAFFLKGLSMPDELVKLLDGLNFLLWAPFLILLPPYSNTIEKKDRYFLLFYFAIMIVLSFITNSRMVIVGPIAMVAAAWIVTLLCGLTFVDTNALLRGGALTIGGLFIMAVFSDLSTAILIERAGRDQRSAGDQIAATLDTFLDKKKIDDYQTMLNGTIGLSSINEWQENYVRNAMLARFIQIKYDDNLFYRVQNYSTSASDDLGRVMKDKILAMFPTPFLNYLGIRVDKNAVNAYSTGDYMDVLSGHGFLGGFKTGSIPANAYGVFGYFYPLWLSLIYVLLFVVYSGLFSLKTRGAVSTLGMLLTFNFFNNMSLDSVSNVAGILVRGVWQTIILFSLLIFLLKVFGVIKNSKLNAKN